MDFAPEINTEIIIEGENYRFGAHPVLRSEPYCQEGRASMVYQIVNDNQKRALKVFKQMHRKPALVSLSDKLSDYALIPGLRVCARTVLTPAKHETLLRKHKDLVYSILMPWIEGPTWFDILIDNRELSKKACLSIASALCLTLTNMEQRGLAHCDLSGPNLILSCLHENQNGNGAHAIQLVDVEGLYSSQLTRPEILVSGTYPHLENKLSGVGEWSDKADRFAGAVLMAEILGWCDRRTREYIHRLNKDTFFNAEELQEQNEGYQVLYQGLHDQWGEDVAELFKRAWDSKSLSQCPTFGEWSLALPTGRIDRPVGDAQDVSLPAPAPSGSEQTLTVLMDLAERLKDQGNTVGAIAAYNQVLSLTTPNSSLHLAVQTILRSIEKPPQPVPPPKDETTGELRPLDLGDIATGEWKPVIPQPPSRPRRLIMTIVAFAGVALLLAIGVLLFGQTTTNNLISQTISGAGLSVAIGLLQTWLFRKRVRKQKRVLFILASLAGGIVGGLVGGLLLANQIVINSILGGLIGAVAGGITAGGQNLLMRSQSTAKGWFFWNVTSWGVVWSIGWTISWATYLAGLGANAATAVASLAIMILTGISLSVFLHFSPDIEF